MKLKRSDVVLYSPRNSRTCLAAGLQLGARSYGRWRIARSSVGLKVVSTKVRQLVRDGNSFFALPFEASEPQLRGPSYCSLAAAGEASGALDTILDRQAHYLKTLQELQGKVVLAMIYPCLPRARRDRRGHRLHVTQVDSPAGGTCSRSTRWRKDSPRCARCIMGASDFFRTKWWLVIVLVTRRLVRERSCSKPGKTTKSQPTDLGSGEVKASAFWGVIERRFYVQFLETMANLGW